MPRESGLRDRKKLQTRERLADVAAVLFAERGYDAVSIIDVARAADVSDQTVYNYFSAKQELVLDRVDEFIERFARCILERATGTTPAIAIASLVGEDVDRYRDADLRIARGEFPAQCLASPVLRRYALEFRERQSAAVAGAILETDPGIPSIVANAYAAALISVVQTITDQIGAHIIAGTVSKRAAIDMTRETSVAFAALDRCFRTLPNETN